MKNTIIAAGHICLDITPVFPAGTQQDIAELLRPGKLINMDAADVHTGGSVANTGLALKKLGNEVKLLGKIGRDSFGGMVKALTEKHGVGGLIEDENSTTSYSVVLAVPNNDRIFLHCTGANDSFSAEDIPNAALEDAVLFHFGYPPLMRRMYFDGGRELEAIFRRMKEQGIATSLDMAAVDPGSEAGRADWQEILKRVLPYVDFFVPSFEELCFMLDKPRYERLDKGGDMTEGLDITSEALPLAEKALNMGCRAVLIKCGTAGMVYKTAEEEKLCSVGTRLSLNAAAWADRQGILPCFVPECLRSATGAGDASIAAFLTAVLRGYTPEDCAQIAAAEGACCVTTYDALSGLKTIEELKTKIDGGWKTAGG